MKLSFVCAGIDLGQLEAILAAAQGVLAAHPDLLAPITNATLPRNSNAADTLSNILENLKPFMAVIRQPGFASSHSLTEYQQRILTDALLPLLDRLETKGSAFRQSDIDHAPPAVAAA